MTLPALAEVMNERRPVSPDAMQMMRDALHVQWPGAEWSWSVGSELLEFEHEDAHMTVSPTLCAEAFEATLSVDGFFVMKRFSEAARAVSAVNSCVEAMRAAFKDDDQ